MYPDNDVGWSIKVFILKRLCRFKNQCDPWIFPFGPRNMQGLVLDCIELVGLGGSWDLAYAKNSILQFFLKSKFVPVVIFQV